MLRMIEKHDAGIVQKVTLPRGELLRYQSVPKGVVGDSSVITCHKTLSEARKALGVTIDVTPVFKSK